MNKRVLYPSFKLSNVPKECSILFDLIQDCHYYKFCPICTNTLSIKDNKITLFKSFISRDEYLSCNNHFDLLNTYINFYINENPYTLMTYANIILNQNSKTIATITDVMPDINNTSLISIYNNLTKFITFQ